MTISSILKKTRERIWGDTRPSSRLASVRPSKGLASGATQSREGGWNASGAQARRKKEGRMRSVRVVAVRRERFTWRWLRTGLAVGAANAADNLMPGKIRHQARQAGEGDLQAHRRRLPAGWQPAEWFPGGGSRTCKSSTPRPPAPAWSPTISRANWKGLGNPAGSKGFKYKGRGRRRTLQGRPRQAEHHQVRLQGRRRDADAACLGNIGVFS